MLAHFNRPERLLELEALDCPMHREISCGTFTTPAAVTEHLLEHHEPWEVAQLAARLSIEANALQEFAHEDIVKLSDDLAESWFPTALTSDSDPMCDGLIAGLAPVADDREGE